MNTFEEEIELLKAALESAHIVIEAGVELIKILSEHLDMPVTKAIWIMDAEKILKKDRGLL